MNAGSLGLAALVALLSAWITKRLCSPTAMLSWLSCLDHPGDRSLHTVPTPRTGGLAILSSLVVGLLLAQAAAWAGSPLWDVAGSDRAGTWLWMTGLAVLLGAVSLWDDRRGLPPDIRFGLHGIAAIGAVWWADLVVTEVPLPLVGDLPLGTLATPLTLLGLMWMTNLYNFMDGMDGFAGGMTVLGFGLLGYLASRAGAQELALVSLLITGAAAGFLVFNLPPARIFMGDVGSVPLGFLAGVVLLMGVRDGVFDLWVPLLIFSPFVLDATVTLFRRLLRGVKVWQAHREHYYQRLVLAGWGHRKTMLAEYGLMLASGATAMLYVHGPEPLRLWLLIMWLVGSFALVKGVHAVELRARSQGGWGVTEGSVPYVRRPTGVLPNLDRIIQGLLLVYICFLPFKGLLFIERNGFIILLVLLGLWCIAYRRHFFLRTPIDLPLAAFVLWVGVTIPFASYPLYSLKEFGKLLQQGLVFYVVLFFFQDRIRWTQLVRLLVGVAVCVSLYGFVQFEETVRGGGSFLRAEVWLTTYLIMMIPLCFALAWYEEQPWVKGLYGLGTVLLAGCLLLSKSRAGLLALLVELWACAWLIRRRTMLWLAGAASLALIVATVALTTMVVRPDGTVTVVPRTYILVKTDTNSIVHRLDIWAFMLGRIIENPVIGIGYGKETSKMLYGQAPEDNLPPGHSPVRKHGTHNILLEVALHVGVPGLLLFVWLAARLWRAVVAGFRDADDGSIKAVLLGISVSLVGLVVRLQFDQMLVGTLAVQFWVLMAVAVLASGRLAERAAAIQQPSAVWKEVPSS